MREYQRSGGFVRKTKAGKWQGILKYRDLEMSPDNDLLERGAWRQITKLFDIPCYPTNNRGKKAAEDALASWKRQLVDSEPERAREEELKRQGRLTPASTVSEFVDAYLAKQGKRVERSTMAGYRRMAGYIADGIGATKVRALTPDMVERWLDGLSKHLAPVTVNKALTVLKATLRYAVDTRALDYSPAEAVRPVKKQRIEPNYLDAAQRRILLEDLDANGCGENRNPASAIGIKLALFTGMRAGEICGLKWNDVDFKHRVVHVRRAIGRDESGSYVKETKNGGSRRDIPMTETVCEMLRQYREQLSQRLSEADIRLDGSMYVLGDPNGSYLTPRLLSTSFWRRAKRLELKGSQGKRPTFHDLRHTFATTAIAEGVDVKSVSSILGHADASMTLNVYASADPEAKRNAVETVTNAL
ncbi:MAG: tyrosine-type recombinase/integrase [Collinsella sp.]|nr:tyrosine-type recombinase/integrase [Collinsella sp.]